MRSCLYVLAVAAIGITLPAVFALPAHGGDATARLQPAETILDLPDHGRLFPAFGDMNRDGKLDLVVGVVSKSGGGRLLVYRNVGTNERPVYENSGWLDESVPSARIPDG